MFPGCTGSRSSVIGTGMPSAWHQQIVLEARPQADPPTPDLHNFGSKRWLLIGLNLLSSETIHGVLVCILSHMGIGLAEKLIWLFPNLNILLSQPSTFSEKRILVFPVLYSQRIAETEDDLRQNTD